MTLHHDDFDLDIRFEPTEQYDRPIVAMGNTESCESCTCQTDNSECFCPSENCPSQTESMCISCDGC
jgi:hypothetical protein